jgi:tRNA (guanosine-2'-O-)-methyltransferase
MLMLENPYTHIMRRRTPGVISTDEFVSAKILDAETLDPERVIRLLEPLVLDRRAQRLREVIDARLGSVRVVFDAPHDPHNGAAILRSCEAFGVQRLHVVERRERFLAAGSVSRGAEKWVDVSRHSTARSAVESLLAGGYALVAAHPEGELLPADLAGIDKLALVVGNERDGIGEDLLGACSQRVRVPMRGFIDSLNVSVTAAMLLGAATQGRAGDLPDDEKRRLYARGLYFSVSQADQVLAYTA